MIRIKVKEAATQLGVTPDYIHHHMRRGDLPIGKVVRSGGPKGKRRTYLIYQELIDKFLKEE